MIRPSAKASVVFAISNSRGLFSDGYISHIKLSIYIYRYIWNRHIHIHIIRRDLDDDGFNVEVYISTILAYSSDSLNSFVRVLVKCGALNKKFTPTPWIRRCFLLWTVPGVCYFMKVLPLWEMIIIIIRQFTHKWLFYALYSCYSTKALLFRQLIIFIVQQSTYKWVLLWTMI